MDAVSDGRKRQKELDAHAQPRERGLPALGHRARGQPDLSGTRDHLPAGFQHPSAGALLGDGRRARPRRNHGEPSHSEPACVLGHAEGAPSWTADRQLLLRRTAQRLRADAPLGAAALHRRGLRRASGKAAAVSHHARVDSLFPLAVHELGQARRNLRPVGHARRPVVF